MAAVILGLSVSGCETIQNSGDKEKVGAVGGAILGGLAGSQVGSGSGRLWATGVGTLWAFWSEAKSDGHWIKRTWPMRKEPTIRRIALLSVNQSHGTILKAEIPVL